MERDLNIFGSGSSGGGTVRDVKIRGEGTITSVLNCKQFKVFGSGEALESITSDSLEIFGTAELHEHVKTNKLKINGTANINGNLNGNDMKIRGTVDVGGNVTGEEMNVKGSLGVKGDCEVENFTSLGSFQIGGLLNAGKVNISLSFGKSDVTEIGGEDIKIKRKISFLGFNKPYGHLTANTIEGDVIYLEHTNASIVRGKKVEIGPGCEIGLVEYNEQFICAKNSNVGANKQI